MKRVSANWKATILVCRKCTKRLGGGFGKDGRKPLAKLLRKRCEGGRGRKAAVGVVELGCLKLCPKKAVVVVDAARPRDWLIVPAGTDIDLLAGRLGLD